MKVIVPFLTIVVSVSVTYFTLSHFAITPLSQRLEKLEMSLMNSQQTDFQNTEVGYHLMLKKQMQAVVELLDLSEQKQKQVLKIGLSFIPDLYQATQKGGAKAQPVIDEIMKEMEEAIALELTPEQLQRYREILKSQ